MARREGRTPAQWRAERERRNNERQHRHDSLAAAYAAQGTKTVRMRRTLSPHDGRGGKLPGIPGVLAEGQEYELPAQYAAGLIAEGLASAVEE